MIPPTVMSMPYGRGPQTDDVPAPDAGTLGRAFSAGWEMFSRQMGMAIVGLLLSSFIMIIGCVIPFLDILFVIFVLPPLVGGMYLFFLSIVRGRTADIGELFSGFSNYGRWLGIFGSGCLVAIVAALPRLIVELLFIIPMIMQGGSGMGNAMNTQFPLFIALQMLSGIVSLVLNCVIMARWDSRLCRRGWGGSPRGLYHQCRAHRRPALANAGHPHSVRLVASAGMLACCIGILFTWPFAQCCIFTYYRDLKALRGQSGRYAHSEVERLS